MTTAPAAKAFPVSGRGRGRGWSAPLSGADADLLKAWQPMPVPPTGPPVGKAIVICCDGRPHTLTSVDHP